MQTILLSLISLFSPSRKILSYHNLRYLKIYLFPVDSPEFIFNHPSIRSYVFNNLQPRNLASALETVS
jgi:hypothetical protein